MNLVGCLGVLALAGCWSDASPVAPVHNAATSEAPRNERTLIAKTFNTDGAAQRVWVGNDRLSHVDTDDPCCGLSYDGNRFNDALASCTTDDDGCGPGTQPIYPGLADDPVCGERRRCMPVPLARLIVRDDTKVEAYDGDEQPLVKGRDASRVAYAPVALGREGFVYVTTADRTERIALDYGSRYTISVERGRIESVQRD
ncbi:MAG TPA: hypothetical protein VL326_19485 [Kofleriaceae bacterium]|jgi:hypothetical protein|nr:hypothetical protein [Kofleriaceae bacterium]